MHTIHDPAGVFAVLLAALLFSAWLSDLLPMHIAAILPVLGIILGPEVLGIIEGGTVLQILGSIGVMYIFFSAGLSANIASRTARRSIVPTSAILKQVFIWTIMPSMAGIAVGLAAGASFIRACAIGLFFASAGARSALKLNKAKFQEQASYGMPAFVPIFSALCLLVLDTLMSGADARSFMLVLAFSFIGGGLVWIAFPRLAALFLRHVKIKGSIEVWFLLFLVFGAAYAGTFFSIPAWFTAFMTGVALSAAAAPSADSELNRIPVRDDIFIPAALLFMGVSARISGILPTGNWILVAVIFVIGGLAARILIVFLSKRFALVTEPLIGLAVPFASFSLAISWILYGSGLFDSVLFLSALALAIISSIISGISMKQGSSGAEAPSAAGCDKSRLAIPNRILIALSKPSSIAQLVELSGILHGTANSSPIFPLVVRMPEETASQQSADSETLLATAVMQLSQMQKSALPLQIEALNAGLGIIDSAVQKNADTIIIGWNKPPRLSHAFFGNVIDQVVSGTSQMVLVARAQFPWKQIKKIYVVAPVLVNRHPGFAAALQCIERLAEATYAHIHFIVAEENAEEVQKIGKSLASFNSAQTSHFHSWRDIPSLIQVSPGSHTMIALISARPGEASWNPAFERLPHVLAEKNSAANVLMLYMPAFLPEEAQASEYQQPLPEPLAESSAEALLAEAVRAGRIRVDMQTSAIADGIYELMFAALPHTEKNVLQSVADHFIEMVQRQPIEIEPGVVLLHDRIENISYPIVCFGAHKKGFRLSTLDVPVQVIVIILVPHNQGAEEHLRFLAEIAALFHSHDLRERLIAANMPENLLSQH